MPIFIPAAIGALLGRATTKKKSKKEDFVAVTGRQKKDGTVSGPHIRRKPKK